MAELLECGSSKRKKQFLGAADSVLESKIPHDWRQQQ
jgi:hypothetical protein